MSDDNATYENKLFKNIDFADKTLRNTEFYRCRFMGCIFSQSDLTDNSFEDCTFEACDFSMTRIEGSGFRNASFVDSKILGVDFSNCNKLMFSFSFCNCHLDHSTFFGTKLIKTSFDHCSLKEVDFSEANLLAASFAECDLAGVIFSNTILEKADFRTAKNYSIDPEFNKISKAKFSASNLAGLLEKHKLDLDYND